MKHFDKWMSRRNEPSALLTSKKSMLTTSEVEVAKEGYREALEWVLKEAKDIETDESNMVWIL
jgi:hypothetical protein